MLYVLLRVTLHAIILGFSPFLTAGKREMLADYSLPVAVLVMSFFGSYVFREVKSELFYTLQTHYTCL